MQLLPVCKEKKKERLGLTVALLPNQLRLEKLDLPGALAAIHTGASTLQPNRKTTSSTAQKRSQVKAAAEPRAVIY